MSPGAQRQLGLGAVGPRALAATWALGVIAQTWATSMLATDHDEPRLVAFLVVSAAVTAVVALVSARLPPARWGDPAKPLAAAELVAWTVLALVGSALLLVLRLFTPSDEQSVRLTLAGSSCLVPAIAGVAALLTLGKGHAGSPTSGALAELDAIAAVIIGGASFLGGRGTVRNALTGALVLAVLRNGLNLLGIDPNWQYIATGAVIVGAVEMDVLRAQLESRFRSQQAVAS